MTTLLCIACIYAAQAEQPDDWAAIIASGFPATDVRLSYEYRTINPMEQDRVLATESVNAHFHSDGVLRLETFDALTPARRYSSYRIGGEQRVQGFSNKQTSQQTDATSFYRMHGRESITRVWLPLHVRTMDESQKKLISHLGQEVFDGHNCDMFAYGKPFKWWVDLDRGCNVLKAEYTSPLSGKVHTRMHGVVLRKIRASDVECWVPVRVQFDVLYTSTGDPKNPWKHSTTPFQTQTYVVLPESIEFNTGVPADDLEIDFDAKRRVFDPRKLRRRASPAPTGPEAIPLIASAAVEKSLELAKKQEAALLAESIRGTGGWSYWRLTSAAVLCIAVAFVLRAWWLRRGGLTGSTDCRTDP